MHYLTNGQVADAACVPLGRGCPHFLLICDHLISNVALGPSVNSPSFMFQSSQQRTSENVFILNIFYTF